MKKIKKLNIIIASLLLLISINYTKSYAIFGIGDISFDPTAYIEMIAENVKNVANWYTSNKNTLDTVKNTAKQIKNTAESITAQNKAANIIVQIGQTVISNLSSTKDTSTNVNTNGAQVVTNLENYLDDIALNEIKKGVSEIKSSDNVSPYTSDILKSVAEFTKNTQKTATGKLVNFTLPYIAKDEICNSSKLKDIVKNGEPDTFTKPKPAVGNVDIEKLCNADLSSKEEGAKAQTSFIGLAKAGYGGTKTGAALADSANTPSGVKASAISNILKNRDETLDKLSKQVEATGLSIGNQTCLDKNGNKVKYDPANPESYCYTQNSTPEESGTTKASDINSSKLSPYISLLSNANSTTNNSASSIYSTISEIVGIGKDLYTTGKSLYDSGKSIYENGKNMSSDLANALSSLYASQSDQEKSFQENENSDFGTNAYTLSNITETIDLYDQVRDFNTDRLNEQAYTYLLLKTETFLGMSMQKISTGFLSKDITAKTSVVWLGMEKATNNIKVQSKKLIKEMALNNYRQQQLKNIILKLKNKETTLNDEQTEIGQIIKNGINEKSFNNLKSIWDYMSENTLTNKNPMATSETNISKLVKLYSPTDEEMTADPYTKNDLYFLRIRGFKTLQIESDDDLKDEEIDLSKVPMSELSNFTLNSLLSGYGINSVDDFAPGLPRVDKVKNFVDSDQSYSYSVKQYCDHLKISEFCTN